MRIVLMKSSHIPACNDITAASEPWKTLKEGIGFRRYIGLQQAYVCIDQGRIAGFLIFNADAVFARGGYLRAIAVAPDVRRSGIGKALMSFAEAKTALRAQHLYLCVSSFNRSARLFYERVGYRKIGSIPGLLKPGASEFIYWKRLTRR